MPKTNRTQQDKIQREIWLSLYYYFIENLSLIETAKRLGVHRLKVTRNIAKAKEIGLFKVIMEHPSEIEFEAKLRNRFQGLKDCRVVPIFIDDFQMITTVLGQVAAKYLEDLIEDHLNEHKGQRVKVGIAGGVSVSKVVDALMPGKFSGLEIFPLTGGPYAQNAYAAGALVDRMASKYQRSTRYEILRFHAATNEEKETILSLKYVNEVLEKIEYVNFAIVGIGNLTEDSTLGRTSIALGLDIVNLKSAKICGDICSLLLKEPPDGSVVDEKTLNLIIGISSQGLKNIAGKNGGRVIAVSGGIEKAEAIAAALLGGTNGEVPWVDTIIIDQKTCERVLEICKRQ